MNRAAMCFTRGQCNYQLFGGAGALARVEAPASASGSGTRHPARSRATAPEPPALRRKLDEAYDLTAMVKSR
jgi:hypothetical protein